MSSGSASPSSGRGRRSAQQVPYDPLADALEALGIIRDKAVSAWRECQAATESMRIEDRRNPRAMLGLEFDADGCRHPLYAHSHEEIDAAMDRMHASVPEGDIGDGATIEAFRTAAHEAFETDKWLLDMARETSGLVAARERYHAAEAEEIEAQRRVSLIPPINLEGCALLGQFLHERSVAREPDMTVIATAARNLATALARFVLDVEINRVN